MREGERLKVQMEERDHEVAKLMRRLEVRRVISFEPPFDLSCQVQKLLFSLRL